MEDGDFLLMDFAPDVGYAQSDVTRMWPVNGKFSPLAARALRVLPRSCYEAILKAIRPGVTPPSACRTPRRRWTRSSRRRSSRRRSTARRRRSSSTSYRKEAERPDAALGHWVGMATHDDGPHEGPLKAGMVFTIEPALRVPEEKIYVRLEDMIVITDKGIGRPLRLRPAGHRPDREAHDGKGAVEDLSPGGSEPLDSALALSRSFSPGSVETKHRRKDSNR